MLICIVANPCLYIHMLVGLRSPRRVLGRSLASVVYADVDECKTKNGGCHSKRFCLNTPGLFRCTDCDSGWVKDGDTSCVEEKQGGGGGLWLRVVLRMAIPCPSKGEGTAVRGFGAYRLAEDGVQTLVVLALRSMHLMYRMYVAVIP